MLTSYYQKKFVLLNMMKKNISFLFFLFFSINLFSVENDKYMDDTNLKELISSKEIAQKIKDVALQIENDYKDKNITFLILLKGAVCFASDLIKEVKTPSTLEFISCSSYGKNGTKRGKLFVEGLDKLDLSNKHVLIIDDIYDSGTTLTKVREKVLEKNPASVKSILLLVKNVKHVSDVTPDYFLFEIGDHFVVGYGLDYKEYYRGLPSVCYFD